MFTPPRSRASSASRSSSAFSASRERRIFRAVSLFADWLRSFWTETTMPLSLEDPVRILAADREGRGLDPVLLPRALVDHLGLEAALLGPAEVHAQEDLGPVLRVGAAGVGLDGDDRVA